MLLAQPSEFDFTPTTTSGSIIASVLIDGNPASVSDWIAAFDEDDNCAGAVQLDLLLSTMCFLDVYGDDSTTDNIDEGINIGETFTFKLWVAATGEILDHPLNLPPVTGWSADLDGATIPGYSLFEAILNFGGPDADGDGFFGEADPDDTDPCNPDDSLAACNADNCLTHQPDLLWQKSYGGSSSDKAYAIKQTSNGGYIFAGSSESDNGHVGGNFGGSDFWVVKLDESGNVQWEKNYGGTKSERANSIQQTSDGGYVAAGWSSSNDGNVGGNNGKYDYWITKLDELGNLQWEKNYGGAEQEYATSIKQTTDGGYICAGYTYSDDGDVGGNNSVRYEDYWIIKIDESGNLEWEKNYGGTSRDKANSIQQTTDGGYIIAGVAYSNNGDVGNNNGSGDYWIIKLDQMGNLEWEKNYGGKSTDAAHSIQQTTDGGYICVGSTNSNDGDVEAGVNGSSDYWIIKLDEAGNLLWEKNYGGLYGDIAHSIQQTTDGGYICAGESSGRDYWIMKLDEAGIIEADLRYGGSGGDYPHSIIQTIDGDYIVAGYTYSNDEDICENFGLGGYFTSSDAWILKLNGECFSTTEITGDTPFQNLYYSCGRIATIGSLIVQQNQQVQYCANRVRLQEGFSVAAGADFKVRIGECD